MLLQLAQNRLIKIVELQQRPTKQKERERKKEPVSYINEKVKLKMK